MSMPTTSPGPDTPPSGRRRQWLGTLIAVALAVGAIWGTTAVELSRDYRQAEGAALSDAANLARALEENLLRAVEAIDQQLLFVRAMHLTNPTYFDLTSEAKGAYLLRDLTFQVTIADKDGVVVRTSLGPVTTRIDLSDREHVRVQRTARDDKLFISKPVIGRVSGQISVQFTRRMETADGDYAGVVVISLDPKYFFRFHTSLGLPGVQIHVVGQDGVIRAAAPATTAIGTAIEEAGLMVRARNARQGAFRGSVTAPNPGQDDFIAFRKLEAFPLLVAVSMDAGTELEPFWRTLWMHIVVALCLSVLVIGAGVLHVHRRRRQAHSRDVTLGESVARFNVAFNAAEHGMCISAPDGRFFRVNAAFAALLGYPEPAFEKLTISDIVHPNEQARRAAWERGLISSDQTGQAITTRFRRADGATIWVRAAIGLVRSIEGVPLYFVSHVRDITAERQPADPSATATPAPAHQ